MRQLKSALGLAMALLSAGVTHTAYAQSSAGDKAAAEALFDDGKKLMVQGDFAQACTKLEQSQRIDPGIGTLLYLAECYEKSGRTASAWATFREAASAARAAGQGERARTGQARADRLEPSLSKLTINVAPEAASNEGFELRRGSEVVPRSLWNVPVPVDPGDQLIEARAPGRKPFSQTVKVGGQAARVAVNVPALEVDPNASEPAAAAPVPTTPASSSESTPASSPVDLNASLGDQPVTDGGTRRTIAFIAGGAGVVGVGVGTFFGLRAISKNSDAKDLCPRGNHCLPAAESLTNQAKDAALVSNIAFGVGAAALIGGAILYFTAPSSDAPPKPEARRLELVPLASAQGGAMLLRGAF